MVMDGSAIPARTGVSLEVAGAAVATTLGFLPLVPVVSGAAIPTSALYLAGWPVFGLVAAVLLDRRPGSRLGRVLTACALVPVLVVAVGLAWGPTDLWSRLEPFLRRSDVALLLAALVAVGWAVGLARDRTSRRRLVWVLAWSVVCVAAVGAASVLASSRALGMVTSLALIGVAGVLLRLETQSEFRPLDEPVVDVAAVVAAASLGAGAGAAALLAGNRIALPLAGPTAAFVWVLTAVLVWPAVLWARRSFLEHRYGTGTLAPEAVAAITAGLNTSEDPHELLDRAAFMITAASGFPRVRLVLARDMGRVPRGWAEHRLVVGGDVVGALLIEDPDPQGPEPRRERALRRILPTVSLMVRAVDLAVEADQARRAVDRERDAERSRILGDLHDGLGPTLAGMSMRVQAELRRRPTPVLASVAEGLADARVDLRRIVSDLTPSALARTGLTQALHRFADALVSDGAPVVLETDLDDEPPVATGVAVYRTVTEAVTNALRHGRPERVSVLVRAEPGRLLVDVRDNGCGGPVVAGVGLTSLRRRVEDLGGRLSVTQQRPSGTHLHAEFPARGTA